MSADATPISPARFASALTSLPLGNLHLKAAELRNSMAHLQASNDQLKYYAGHHAEEGDRDYADAIAENVEVLRRMQERIELLKQEVEGRGYKWDEVAGSEARKPEINGQTVNGHADSGEGAEEGGQEGSASTRAPNAGGERRGLTDEEVTRRLREQMDDDDDLEEQDGVHL